MDRHGGKCSTSYSGSKGYEFSPHSDHCFNSRTQLGQLVYKKCEWVPELKPVAVVDINLIH